jgi:hypothetical protein
MSEEITRKEFYAAIRYLRDSYTHGEISEDTLNRLVKLASNGYYGQQLDKIMKKYWGN